MGERVILNPIEARAEMVKLSDDDIKHLLRVSGRTVLPYNRENAIDMLAGPNGDCSGCNQSGIKVSYINSQDNPPCKTCG